MAVVHHARTRFGAPSDRLVTSDRSRSFRRLGASLALSVVVGAPWLNVSASATTPEPSPTASAEPSPSAPSPTPHYGEPVNPSDPHCETSQGIYPRPLPSGSADWLPSWVSPSDGFVCVQLDASSLLDSPNQSWLGPEPAPSTLLDTEALSAQVASWRELYLYSTGVLIFLTAGLLFRVRSR